jgi:hypothetical protein
MLDESSRLKALERRSQESQFLQDTLGKVPYPVIYIF